MTRQPLSPIEEAIYRFLIDFLAEHTFQPSVREIAEEFGIASTKTVADLLASLERKGYIAREAGRSRGVTLLGFAGGAGTIPVPVLRPDGTAGTMVEERSLTLDRSLVGAAERFLVRAWPHGSAAHGILEGDLVVVDPVGRARDGEAVVVRIGGAILVRALQRVGSTLRLAGGAEEEPIELGPGDDYAVLGLPVGVIRVPSPSVDG